MKKLQLGLIVEGNSTSSAVLRLPSVAAELGPVKAGSLQVARRASNFLRGGYAVNSYEELSAARIILIRVPDASVARVVAELCESDLDLSSLCFVLCETWMQTEALEPLREQGSAIASMVAMVENQDNFLAVEGDAAVVRHLRRIMERGEMKTVELEAGSKHLVFAAALMLRAMPMPMMLAAQQALRESGISGNQLAQVVEELTLGTLYSFLRGSKSIWGGTLAGCTEASAGSHFARLNVTHPDFAATLRDLMTWASVAGQKQELSRSQMA